MSKQAKKVLTAVLAIMMLCTMVFGFAGCGDSGTEGTASDESAAATSGGQEVKEEAKPVELNFWEQDEPSTVDPIWDEIATELNAKYPHITVTRTHL